MAKRQVSKKTRKATKKKSKAAKKVRKATKKASKAAKKKPTKRLKQTKSKAPWAAAQLRDYRALEKRAMTLAESLTNADFDAEGNPVNPAWSRLLSDLDAWAAKYSVKLSKREHSHAGGGATDLVPMAAGGSCPGSFQTKPTYHTTLPNGTVLMEQTSCVLRRRGLFGRCVYSCTDGIYSV